MLSRQTLLNTRRRPGQVIVLPAANRRNDALQSAHWWLSQQLNLHDIMPDEDKVQLPHPNRRAVWEMYIKDVENVELHLPLIKVRNTRDYKHNTS